ncbi:DUF454 family protein [Candidatus Poribacteria bacterium]|nr:DUF454 family protein [Candidatus Poribacteria bacterium]
MKRYFLIIFGILSLGLGILGIFLPLLPTTPFLLLSAYCFYRSSRRLYLWLMNHRIFGKIIKNYSEKRAVDLKTKLIALITLWVTIFISIYIFLDTIYIPILLFIIASMVSLHILSLNTIRE